MRRAFPYCAPSLVGRELAWTCPGLMDTPKSARVRAIGVDDGEGAEAEAAEVLGRV
jgi:hypothetical protein